MPTTPYRNRNAALEAQRTVLGELNGPPTPAEIREAFAQLQISRAPGTGLKQGSALSPRLTAVLQAAGAPDASPNTVADLRPCKYLPTLASTDPEPILCHNNRWTILPIVYDKVWKMYKQHVACFWTPEEINLRHDREQFEALKEDEQHFNKLVLAFFAASDGLVNENLVENFAVEVQVPEICCFYNFQSAMENIHNKTYSLLIDTYLAGNHLEKLCLLQLVDTIPCVGRKAEWTKHWCDARCQTLAKCLIAFAAVEGIFFSSSFCAIFWLKQRGILPGLCFSDKLIS